MSGISSIVEQEIKQAQERAKFKAEVKQRFHSEVLPVSLQQLGKIALAFALTEKVLNDDTLFYKVLIAFKSMYLTTKGSIPKEDQEHERGKQGK